MTLDGARGGVDDRAGGAYWSHYVASLREPSPSVTGRAASARHCRRDLRLGASAFVLRGVMPKPKLDWKENSMLRGTRLLTGREAAQYIQITDMLRRLLHRR